MVVLEYQVYNGILLTLEYFIYFEISNKQFSSLLVYKIYILNVSIYIVYKQVLQLFFFQKTTGYLLSAIGWQFDIILDYTDTLLLECLTK